MRKELSQELSQAEDIYREHILEHYKHPRNFGGLDDAEIKQREVNHLCGDELEFSIKLQGKKIVDVRFKGRGCAISIASASLLSEEIKGKTLEAVMKIKNEDVIAMLGIPIGAVRYKCAILSLMSVKAGIYNYLKR